jgi:hypothetical protein
MNLKYRGTDLHRPIRGRKKNTAIVSSVLHKVSIRFVISHRISSANKMMQTCSDVRKTDGYILV